MVTIRPARASDVDAVVAIVRHVARHLLDQDIDQWDEVYPSRAILRGDIEREDMCVAEDADRVVGFVTLNEEQSPEYRNIDWSYSGRVLVVHRLGVDPAHQRKGVASRLMDFAEKEARSRGYEAIRLDAFTLNPAAGALYANRGYRMAGTVRFRKGEFLCYEKRLGPEAHR